MKHNKTNSSFPGLSGLHLQSQPPWDWGRRFAVSSKLAWGQSETLSWNRTAKTVLLIFISVLDDKLPVDSWHLSLPVQLPVLWILCCCQHFWSSEHTIPPFSCPVLPWVLWSLLFPLIQISIQKDLPIRKGIPNHLCKDTKNTLMFIVLSHPSICYFLSQTPVALYFIFALVSFVNFSVCNGRNLKHFSTVDVKEHLGHVRET